MATWEALLSAADKQVSGFRNLVLSAAEHAGAAVDWSAVETAIESGQISQAVTLIDASWQPSIADAFQTQIKQQSLTALGAGAGAALDDVAKLATDVPQAVLGGVFDITNPRAVLFASTRSSDLIVHIVDSQRAAVRQIITRATSGEFSTRRAAQLVRGVVGLDPRRAQALATFSHSTFAAAPQTAKGFDAAQRAVNRYRDKLMRQRAEVIARTEVLSSAHEGLQEAWTAARVKGVLGQGMVKRWIITPDDRLCPYCKQMKQNGVAQQVKLDEPFITPFGPKMVPPMHPQCRCSMGLVRGLPNAGKGVPIKPVATTKSSATAFRPPPRVIDTPTSRSFPVRPPTPPDPPEIIKLKSLGVEPDTGLFTSKPWQVAAYDDVIDQAQLQQVIGKAQYIDTAFEVAPENISKLVVVNASSNGIPLTPATLDSVRAILDSRGPLNTGVMIVRNGKQIIVSQDDKLLAAWATNKPVKTLKIDIDQYLLDNTPTTKIDALGVTQDGFVSDLPFGKAKSPYSPAFMQKGITKAAKAPTQDFIDPNTILVFDDAKVLNSTAKTLTAIDSPGTIKVYKIDGSFVAANDAQAVKALSSWAKGEGFIAAEIHDIDAAVVQIKAANKAASLKHAAKKKATVAQPVAGTGTTDYPLHPFWNDIVNPPSVVLAKAKQVPPTIQKQVYNEWINSPKTLPDLFDEAIDAHKAVSVATPTKYPLTWKANAVVKDIPDYAQPQLIAKFEQLPAALQDEAVSKWLTSGQPIGDVVDEVIAKQVGGETPTWLDELFGAQATTEIHPEVVKMITSSSKLTAKTDEIKALLKQVPTSEQHAVFGDALGDALLKTGDVGDNVVAILEKKLGPTSTLAPSKVSPLSGSKITQSLDDIVFKKIGDAQGSNPGGLFEARDGTKWYAKFYNDADQGYGEVLANQIYRDLGVGAPQSVTGRLADGRIVFASKYLDDTVRTVGTSITKTQADQILDGFAGDVLTANWDAVGTGLDNVVIGAGGKITRIDQGGTFLFRAKAGRKPANLLDQITEWDVFADANRNPYYASVFKAADIASADELGKRIVNQIDDVLRLEKSVGGWDRYVAQVLPDVAPSNRIALVNMLDARTRLLKAKRDEIVDSLRSAAPRVPSAPIARRAGSDQFGTQLDGHATVDEAVSGAWQKPGQGTSLPFDGDDIEGLDIRVRAVTIDGQEYTELKFKFTDSAGERFRTASPLRYELREQGMTLPKQKATRGVAATYIEDKAYREFPTAKTFVYRQGNTRIYHHKATDDGFAYGNLTQVYLKGKPTADQIRDVFEQMGIRATSYPSQGAVDAYIENAFVRLFQTGNKSVTGAKRTQLLKEVHAKYGVGVEDVEMVLGELGRPTLQFTEAAYRRLQKKLNVGYFQHSLNDSDTDTLFAILSGDQQGLAATTVRYTEGVNKAGMSSLEDANTGGADYVFTTPKRGVVPDRASHGVVYVKPESLRRLDWYAYDYDRYGVQNPNHSSFGNSVSQRDNLQNIRNGAERGTGEVMFRYRIGFRDIAYVSVSRAYRQELISRLRNAGITQLGGRPVEQFIREAY